MMNFKLQVLLAFLNLRLSMALPGPETAVNINVNVKGSSSNLLDDQLDDNVSSDTSSFHNEHKPVPHPDHFFNTDTRSRLSDQVAPPQPSDFSYIDNQTHLRAATNKQFIIKGFYEDFWPLYVTIEDPGTQGSHLLLRLKDDSRKASTAYFEPADGIWGYIRFVGVKPNTLSKPLTESWLELSVDGGRYNQFAIDQVNHRIIHRSREVMHKASRNGIYPVALGSEDDRKHRLETYIIDPNNPSKQVLVYGVAKVVGEWNLVFAVDNPLIDETYEVKYKVGKSKTESTDKTIKFGWELEVGAEAWFASFSETASFSAEIREASSHTWNEETVVDTKYAVKAGVPVAVWQRSFIGTQLGSKATFNLNRFYHTTSASIEPPS